MKMDRNVLLQEHIAKATDTGVSNFSHFLVKFRQQPNTTCNRIYNKILDCDWFSPRLFVT